MTIHAPESCVQISHVHSAAICKEIGEVLRTHLGLLPVPPQSPLVTLMRQLRASSRIQGAEPMKDFPYASFPPEIIEVMTTAIDIAVATLPHPVSSAHIRSMTETILRSTQEGERDPATLGRMALLELLISSRD